MTAFSAPLTIPNIEIVINPSGGLRVYADKRRTVTVDTPDSEIEVLQRAKSDTIELGFTTVKVTNFMRVVK